MRYILPDNDKWLYWDGQNKYYYNTQLEAINAMTQSAMELYISRLLDLKVGISTQYDNAKILTRFGEDTEAVEQILALPILDADGKPAFVPNTAVTVIDAQKLIATLQAIEVLMENPLATTGELPRKTLGKLIGGK
jgi:hypothetical protein